MEQYKTRKTVWRIAILDLILTSISLVALICVVFIATVLTAVVTTVTVENDTGGQKPAYHQAAAVTFLIWLAVFIFSVVVIVQLVAAVKLLNASQEGKDRFEAVKLCKFWRAVTIVFIIATILQLPFSGEGALGIGFGVVNVVVRYLAVFYVQRFMHELNEGPMTTLPLYQTAEDDIKFPPSQDPGINPFRPPPSYDQCVEDQMY